MRSGEYVYPGHGCTSFTQRARDAERLMPPKRRFYAVPWIWVHCASYLCGHHRAITFAPWAIRWGVDDPGDLIRKNFRCVMCARKGALFTHSGVEHDSKTYAPFPVEHQVGIGGERLASESCIAREERCAAIYESKRPIWSKFWQC
jgi:hypothetical protein